MADHYETLGVARDADATTIKAAYRKLAAQHHPDKPGGDQAKFQALAAAYATLSDPDKRAHYDRTGQDGERVPSEMEMIAPLVVGAFDRAAEKALGGSQDSRMATRGLRLASNVAPHRIQRTGPCHEHHCGEADGAPIQPPQILRVPARSPAPAGG